VTDEARERWRRQHRRQRVRAPKVAAARRAATALALVLTAGFAVLGVVAGWGWFVAAVVSLYLALRLMGIHPFAYGDDSGIGTGT
jgi:fatty acid desaturase